MAKNELLALQVSARQAAFGGQHYLVIDEAPAGAEALVGQRLVGQTLTVAGDYFCNFPLSGCQGYKVELQATFAAGSVTSDVNSTQKDGVTSRQGFSGDGALTTATKQTASLATIEGEQVGRAKITVGATTSAAFTLAECLGS